MDVNNFKLNYFEMFKKKKKKKEEEEEENKN